MLIRSHQVGDGPGPSEAIVEISTRTGTEEVVISSSLLRDGHIDIGAPVGRDATHLLVELPRETSSGKWRVWVAQDVIKTDQAA